MQLLGEFIIGASIWFLHPHFDKVWLLSVVCVSLGITIIELSK